MHHGYTNETTRHDAEVHRTYDGPDAPARCVAELRALTRLRGLLPVPGVIASGSTYLRTAFIVGEHGQDLIEAGEAERILAACGSLLRQLHELDPSILDPDVGTGTSNALVIRHGDFGPDNVLFEPRTVAVTALLDWEFCGTGPAVDDIAWCEWIVRMHHPGAVRVLPAFFDAYGSRPPWPQRKAAMLGRCRQLEEFCRQWDPLGAGMEQRRSRAAITATWSE